MVQIDIEFPSRCSDCELEIENLHNGYIWSHECPLVYKGYTDRFRDEGKHIDCPLIEVKDDERRSNQKAPGTLALDCE